MYKDLEYLKVNLPEDILIMKCNGNFDKALYLIDMRLEKEIPFALRKRLELEKNIINVIRDEYIYSFEDALNMMKENIKDFNEEELIKLQEESAADWILVDGKVKFNESFYGNLIKTIPDLSARLTKQNNIKKQKEEQLLDDNIDAMKANGSVSYFIHMKNSIRIKEEYARLGEVIKVHLPIPKDCQQLSNIKIIKTSPLSKIVASPSFSQRTAYFEEILKQNDEFSVEYSYENHVQYIELDAKKVSEKQPNFDTDELYPHINFTPYIKELAKEIVGDETNQLIKARKIYDFITTKVKYSYMRKYFTITNIPEYAALNLKGDCGVQSLLFITLCRCVNIPAKWQSGLYVMPYYVSCHDWAQFFIEPYGWLFADPSFGGDGYRLGNLKKWNFYFGNIDPFRMVSSSEFQHEFDPQRKHLRYDPYDNQTGECEYADSGLMREMFLVNMQLVEMNELKKQIL